ncbi:hypothetical protein LX32DRAFT_334222 [Colletotrichum zoysiae]|uniref:Uncharacterized protein n=1 Tax=Colletotrichum zoysiae TaxID=1216348 RepID=A0AAD9HLC4_9PEZI|nr:hypothetical protein LX32DRAFT_334222 [Colletotrichum zoysiae]
MTKRLGARAICLLYVTIPRSSLTSQRFVSLSAVTRPAVYEMPALAATLRVEEWTAPGRCGDGVLGEKPRHQTSDPSVPLISLMPRLQKCRLIIIKSQLESRSVSAARSGVFFLLFFFLFFGGRPFLVFIDDGAGEACNSGGPCMGMMTTQPFLDGFRFHGRAGPSSCSGGVRSLPPKRRSPAGERNAYTAATLQNSCPSAQCVEHAQTTHMPAPDIVSGIPIPGFANANPTCSIY